MPDSALQALLSISQIDLRKDRNHILKEILIVVGHQIGGHSGSIMLVNEENGELEMVATFGLPDDYIDRVYARGVPITRSPSGVALETGEYYVVPNIFKEPRSKWWADLAREFGFSAQLFMPIKHKSEVIGLLNIYMAEPHEYTHNEITFVRIAASQAAAVIENARLYAAVSKEKTKLESEVSEHKRVEELLWESKEILSNILSASPIGIGIVKDRKLYWTNDRMLEMMGFTPDDDPYEYVDQSAEVIYASKEEYERVGRLFYEELKKGAKIAGTDAKLKRKDGSLFDGRIKMSFLDPSNPTKGAVATISDITWEKQAEEQLRVSEEKFRTFMETARDLMHILNKDGNFTYVNESMATTLGYSKEELLGVHITQILTKKSLSEYFESRWNTLVTKGELTLDTGWVTKGGKEIHGGLKVVAIYDEDGTFAGTRAIFHDITERKRMEEELQRSETLYRTLFEATSVPTVILDGDGTFYRVNEEGAKLSGFTKEELEGKKSWTEFIAKKEDLEMMKEIHRLRRTDPDKVPKNYEFLFKDRYGNLRNIYVTAALIPGTERSVVSFADLTELKKAEKALRDSEEYYRSLIENALDGVMIVDERGNLQYQSVSVERIIGYKCEEQVGKSIFANIHPEDKLESKEVFSQLLHEKGAIKALDLRVKHKDGSWRTISGRAKNLVDNPAVRGIVFNYRDITDRTRAEDALRESEARLRSLFETMTEGVILIDPDGQIVQANSAAEQILGLTRSEIENRNYVDSEWEILRPDGTPMPPEEMAGPRAMKEKHPIRDVRMGVKRTDGTIRWIDVSAAPLIKEDGTFDGVVGTFIDITERKRAEEALRESEEKYRVLVETAREGIIVAQDGMLKFVNAEVVKEMGYSPEELTSTPFHEFIHPDDREMVLTYHAKRLKGEDAPRSYPCRVISKGGNVIWTELNSVKITWERRPATLTFLTNITDRKKAADALREKEKENQTILNSVPLGVYHIDANGRFVHVNDVLASRYGLKAEDFKGKTSGELFPKEAKKYVKSDKEVLKSGKPRIGATGKVITPQGVRWVRLDKVPVRDAAGNVTGIIGFELDVTEQRKAEEALWVKDFVIGSSINAIAIADLEGRVTHVNPSFIELWGYDSTEEVLGKSVLDFWEPKTKALEILEQLLAQNGNTGSWTGELIAARKDGSTFDALVTTSTVYNNVGKPVGLTASFIDITERKRAEEARRKSEGKYRTLIENMQDGVFIIRGTKKPRLEFCNEAFAKMVGYTVDEVIGLTFEDYIAPEDLACVTDRYLRRQAGEDDVPQEYEYRALHKDGKTRVRLNMNVGLIEYKDGLASLGTVKDVTERRKMEQKLRNSEKWYRTLIHSSSDIIFVLGKDGTVRYMSPSVERILGYKPEDMIGKNGFSYYHPDDVSALRAVFLDLIQQATGTTATAVSRALHKDGSVVYLEVVGENLLDDPQIRGVVGNCRDITERMKVEEQIKKSLQEKELLLQEIHHRVKNNMQVISSLLNLQSRHITDEEALAMFTDTQSRVKSMALVHEKLYQSGDIVRINFADYIRSLTSNLFQSYREKQAGIKLTTDVGAVLLDLPTAIPCGLVINELTSNALKYAFPDGKKGDIHIALHQREGDELELIVSDNGIGFPEALDFRNSESLGLQLVNALVKEQLDGTIELDRSVGTTFKITFKSERGYKEQV